MSQEITPANSFYPVPARAESRERWETAKQLFFVVFKWKRLILGVFLAFTIAAGIAMALKPPVRSATAEILIKVDRMPLQISGLAARPDRGQVSQIMNSEVELLESRHVLAAVATKLLSGLAREITDEELEAQINSLSSNLFAVAVPNSNVLQITYFAQTGKEAERTLELIIDEYIEKQAAIQSGSERLLKFYAQEKHRVENELRASEGQLNEWQGKNETVSIAQQITSQLNILEDRNRTLQQTHAQLEATRAKVAMLQDQLKGQPEHLVMGQDQVKNPLAAKLKDQLVAAEASLQDLLQRFTEKHRSVREKRDQIAFLKNELAASEENIVGRETTGLNPFRQNVKQQLSEAQALLSSLVSQRQIVQKQVEEAVAVLASQREKKVKIDELSRLVELNKDAFMLYGKKLEEGRVATGLGKEQLANVALIGPPNATAETDFGKRLKIVLLSSFVGLALGMAIAFGFEFFSSVLRTRQDVEYYLGLPVLAAIPDLHSRPLLTD